MFDKGGRRLGEHFRDDVAVDVGESEIASLEAVGEPRVFEPQEMEDGGVEIMDVDFVLRRIEPECIRLAERRARFRAAAG